MGCESGAWAGWMDESMKGQGEQDQGVSVEVSALGAIGVETRDVDAKGAKANVPLEQLLR